MIVRGRANSTPEVYKFTNPKVYEFEGSLVFTNLRHCPRNNQLSNQKKIKMSITSSSASTSSTTTTMEMKGEPTKEFVLGSSTPSAKPKPKSGGLDLDDSSSGSKELEITSKDNKKFAVTRKNAGISVLIKQAIETEDTTESLPLSEVTGDILKLVVKYMNQWKGEEPQIPAKPLKNKEMSKVTDAWSAKFIDDVGKDKETLYNLILAANYMNINSLLHLGCAKVASLIKGQPLEKIKEILSTEEDKKKAKASKEGEKQSAPVKDAPINMNIEKEEEKESAPVTPSATLTAKEASSAATAKKTKA